MLTVPSRISGLIEKLEASEEPSPEELRRIARLQALDLAKAGEDYAAQSLARDSEYTEKFRQLLET